MGNNKEEILRLLRQRQGQETDRERILRLLAEKKAQQGGTATVVSSVPEVTAIQENNDRFFKAGAFSDGYQFGDVVKTILGTAGDIGINAVKGAGSLVEGVTDLLGYAGAGIADLVGADEFASDWKKSVQQNTVDAIFKGAEDYVDQASVLGGRSDAISQGLGQVAAILLTGGAAGAAGLGSAGATALTTAVTGLSGMGSGMSQAYQEGATDGEAVAYGAISGTAEALTELIFAGMGKSIKALGFSKGLSSADDILAKKLSSKISSQLGKNLVELGVKAGAEGTEEVMSGIAQALGKKLTYMSEEDLGKIVKDERLFDQFLTGAITSGIAQSGIVPGMKAGSFREANKTGRDLITGLTQNEQAVVDKVYADRVAERKKSGELSKKQEAEIYDKVLEDMEQGRISTDTIESVLGGDTYKGYQSLVEQEKTLTERQNALQAEIDALQGADNTIGNNRKMQKAESELEEVTEKLKGIDVKTAKSNLFSQVDKLTANDTKLRESYNERTRRGQAFTADLSQYDEKLRPTIQRAIDNGEINNTRATHAFVEGLAKIEAEKGIGFDFTNNQRLAELGLTVAGRNVGGYVDGTNVTLNLSSSEALNKVVGHEVTHVFEGSGQYDALMTAMKEFAAEKGIDWDARVQEMTERYQNVKNADPEKELLADLVGEYLFTDSSFVESLSTKNPGLFKKIYEEIKYLAKTFAGTKQGAALEKVKKTFAELYREADVKNTAQTDGVRYSLNIKHTDGSVEMLADARSLTTEQAVEYLKQAKSGALRRDTYIPVRKDTPQVIIDTLQQVNENVENLSMVMSVDKAQRAMAVSNTGTKTKKYGDNVRKHGLLPEEIVEIINNLDNPNTVIYQTNRFGKDGEQLPNSVAVFVEYSTNGNEGMAAVEFENPRNADAIGTEFGETNYHTVITVFEPDVERKGLPFDYVEELLSNPDNYELEIKRRQLEGSATGEKHPNTSNELPYIDSIRNPDEKVNEKFSLSETEGTAPVGGYRITGEDIALAPTKEDIARMEQERNAAATSKVDDAGEELGAPTREDIANQERDKKLKGPLLMKDSLDRELEKLYRLQQTGQIQDDAYFAELFKVNAAYQEAGRNFNEAFSRVYDAYQGEVETQTAVAGEDSTQGSVEEVLSEGAGIRSQLRNSQKVLDAMQPVAEIQIPAEYTQMDITEKKKWVEEKLRPTGYKVERKGFGIIDFAKKRLKSAFNYFDKNSVEEATFEAIPYVLENGVEIENRNVHKDRNYGTVTIAAPITINGKRGNMAVVVKRTDGNYYKVHRVLTPDGSVFYLSEKTNEAESTPAGESPINGSLATPKDSASTISILDDAPAVKQEEVEAVLGEKGAYVSKQANALYDEVKSMQKGKRVSNTLSYLLDTLDLSEEHKAESYNSLRTALLNIRDNPNQVVNPNSAVEAVAREMLGREYDAMAEDFVNAEGVAKSIYTKIESLRTELENNQSLREQSNADFDSELARLQTEYEGKKNKNTKAANDILRRIERVQRLKSQVDADYSKRIDRIGEQLERISKPEYKTAMQRKAKMEEYTNLMAELVGDTSTWVDKKMGLSYSTNTFRRNLRDIVRDENGNRDIAKADAIYDELQGKYNHNEAELKRESLRIKEVFQKLGLNHAEDTYAHMLGEFQYNPDSKLSQEQLEEYYKKHKSKIDTKKVDKAIAEARKVFDDLIVRVNERLKEQGMKQIPYRKGYFPHFTNPKQTWLHKLFNWKPVDNEIPTSIAGLTEEFNPQRSWQSFDKQRTSDATDYSLEQGLDSYIHGALDWIYHIEDIQKRRALENHIRYVHSDEGIKKRIDEIRNNESYDADEAQELIDAVYAEAKNPLNNFVSDLRTGTNTLANKKSSLDRKAEEMTNRKIYSVMTNLNSRINANMVVGSFSSALTNFIPITQSWMEVSPVYSLKGMRDTIKSTIRDDGVVNKSDFLTNRLMNEEKLYQTGWDKVSEKAGFMMEAIDSFTSQTVWRSKYLQNIAEGMSEAEAIKNADQFAENVIAGRSRGNQPTIFDAKNPLTKIFTAFQLEVANQYGYMFKDAPQDSKNKGRLIKGYATAFLGAYAYNALYSSLVGRDAAFDPISILEDLFRDLFEDDEEEPEDVILNLTDNILEEVPFVGGLMGGGRVPISSAIPYEGDYKTFITDIANGELSAKEMLKPLYYLAMPVAGGQLKKTNEGLKMFDEDLPVAGSYTDSGNLRFPVEEDSIADWLQAALFGQYASKNAREYFDNGWAPLKEKQIEEFAALDIPIADYREIRKQLGNLGTLGEKLAYIHTLDLPVSKKNILANNQTDRNEPIDMAEWGKLEEFDYAVKYPEKAQFLVANGISVEEYNKFDDETKDAYDWAYLNPEKHAVAKTVTDDIVTYRTYTKALSEIKADKDSAGKTVSGSRKKKVVQYINGLDAEYGAKLVLYKLEYPSDDTYNGKIIQYVNSIEGFTFEQKETVLKELGFTVTSDGRVTWD